MKIQSQKVTASFKCDKSKKAELIKLAKAKKLTESELYRQIVENFLESEKQQAVDNATLDTKLDNILAYQKELLEVILAYKANSAGEQSNSVKIEEIERLLDCHFAALPGAVDSKVNIYKAKKADKDFRL